VPWSITWLVSCSHMLASMFRSFLHQLLSAGCPPWPLVYISPLSLAQSLFPSFKSKANRRGLNIKQTHVAGGNGSLMPSIILVIRIEINFMPVCCECEQNNPCLTQHMVQVMNFCFYPWSPKANLRWNFNFNFFFV